MTNLSDDMLKWADAYEIQVGGNNLASPDLVIPVDGLGLDYFELLKSSGGGLTFGLRGNGFKVDLTDYHGQECCEDVAADWDTCGSYLDSGFKPDRYTAIEIVRVKGEGFLIRLRVNPSRSSSFFVPCHNIQNGYYSSDLELMIDFNKLYRISLNLDDCTKDTDS
jgi:hypothetical protein